MQIFKGRSLFKAKILRANQLLQVPMSGAKAGATAGWTVNSGVDTEYANCPASQTAATLIIPLPGLNPGDTITGFRLNGAVISAGGAVTVDAALHKQVPTSGAVPTDTSIGAITQVAVTANALLSSANTRKASLSESVADGNTYYLIITVTTAASTSVNLVGATVEYNKNS